MTTVAHEPERYSPAGTRCIQALDARIAAVEAAVRQQEYWHRLVANPADPAYSRAMLREIMLGTYWYQPHTTEAGFHMIGRLPKTENRWLRVLLNHKAEEAEHGNWALRDYLALGGVRALAASEPSPPVFAVIAVWWQLARTADPIGYLGAEYLFEELTARLAADLAPALVRSNLREGIGFVTEHATEDVKHANLIRHLVGEAATRYPGGDEAILSCFDRFHHVYPLPVWHDAHVRALAR
jgi:pyrroloquinoline quinone (PQQ) biosynthesis protein C